MDRVNMAMLKIVFVLTIMSYLQASPVFSANPAQVIFDTDISSDVDDVGAVAVLHALANQGKVDILGMMVSSGDPWSAPCLDALNTWFGRPDIAVGVVSGESVRHESKYTREIASSYPHDFTREGSETDAVTLYRRLLSGQPDNSVTIITVGYLTNLAGLLQSQPDGASPLSGAALVKKKVKQLVCMGGKYPSGREWNFYQDSNATADAIRDWPSPILFCGYESGVAVLTGSGLRRIMKPNPVNRSYELYNGLTDRPSWDQLTVLFGVLSHQPLTGVVEYFSVQQGINIINSDGSNTWKNQPDGDHGYTVNLQSNSQLKKIIETLMTDAIEKAILSY